MEKKRLKGERYDAVAEFYGTSDPDTPNLSSEQLKRIFECAKPKLGKPIGKVVIIGVHG